MTQQGYAASCQAAVANPRTIGLLINSTTKRGEITAFTLGQEGTPADNVHVWDVLRFTASGTATVVTTAKKYDAEDNASLTVEENCTVEPTYAGGEIFRMGLAARASYTRQYAPGKGIKTNLATDNGVGFRAAHATATVVADVVIEWEE